MVFELNGPPVLINIIRNPVDFFQAAYHIKSVYSETPLRKIDDCVQEGDPECWNLSLIHI